MKVTLFTKADKPTVKKTIGYLKKHFNNVTIYQGKIGSPLPEDAFNGSPDILISYLSAWVIPREVLKRTKLWNINFHPAPPEYPGIGCFNLAIYNRERTYGVTAHLMCEKVDRGKIVAIKRFPLLETDSVYSLSLKCYEYMFSLFTEVMDLILRENKLPDCNEVWKRRPFTRKELEELCKISPNMSKEEIERRIKATTYPNMPGAYIDIFGYTFEYNPNRLKLL